MLNYRNDYSYLNASIGSRFEALYAGYVPNPTPITTHKNTPIIIQSMGKTAVAFKNEPATLPAITPRIIPTIPPPRHNETASIRN